MKRGETNKYAGLFPVKNLPVLFSRPVYQCYPFQITGRRGLRALTVTSGSQIRAARAGLGWSRETLAERAGLHPKSVAYWERTGVSVEPACWATAPGRIFAALRSAGVEIATEPRPAVFFDRVSRKQPMVEAVK